jgi:hypothetical protein
LLSLKQFFLLRRSHFFQIVPEPLFAVSDGWFEASVLRFSRFSHIFIFVPPHAAKVGTIWDTPTPLPQPYTHTLCQGATFGGSLN